MKYGLQTSSPSMRAAAAWLTEAMSSTSTASKPSHGQSDAMLRITQAAFAGDRNRLLEGVNLNLQKAE